MTDDDMRLLRRQMHHKHMREENVREHLETFRNGDRSHSDAVNALFKIAGEFSMDIGRRG